MTPIEAQVMAEVLFWYAVIMIVCAACSVAICYIFDGINETPEERTRREADSIAKQATKEFNRRPRVVRFFNY